MSESCVKDNDDKKNIKDNSKPLKPNKSALYTIIQSTKPQEDTAKEEKKEEKKEEAKDEKKDEKDEKKDDNKKIEKNVSTLYKIVSSKNLVVKPLKSDPGGGVGEEDDIEYEDIIENQNLEMKSKPSVAENAIYYVEENKKNKKDKKEEEKGSETKKSSIEITLTPSLNSKSKRAQSTIEATKPVTTQESFFSIRKTNSENTANDLGDLSTIRFSFLDRKPESKSNELMYDTIDESKATTDSSNRDYTSMSDSSGTENVYSSPRASLTSGPTSGDPLSNEDYITTNREISVDKSEDESELFYAASEVLNLRPSTPRDKRKSSTDYEDLELENEKLPEIPNKHQSINLDEYADVDVNDYCRHREENPKKIALNSKDKKAMVKVRSKINKAWKSMKNWINEEREQKESPSPRPVPRVEIIEVVREEKEPKALEAEPETDTGNESPVSESPRFCFLNENVHFLDIERNNSDSGTYMDMTRSVTSESSSDIFSTFTLLRKRREGSSGTPTFRKSRYYSEGQNGFEELRRYIKQGGDFCKELSVILQERSEAEIQYAKSLSKLSHKLLKTSKDAVGSVSEAWQRLGAEMEAQSEIHRTFAAALSEEVIKPLKQMVDTQHRIRKNVESVVDKTGKTLAEWRQAECKSKKQSFLCARENEKLQDTMLDIRNNRNASTLHLHHHNHKNISDKESAKLDLKRKKAEESVKKADIEYYSFCVRAERSRLDWESAVTRGSHCFQGLEEERLACLKSLASCYLKHFKEIGPKLIQSSDRLTEPVETCDVTRDIQTVIVMKGSGQPTQEQLLPDFYAEHVTLAMNRERRKQALVKLLQLIRQDLEREKRGKQGVENLQRALQQTPTFGAEESQQNVDEKLYHMKSMLIYLEAAKYKVQSALTELDGKSKLSHPLASHIHMTRDRQGLQQSVLRVPPWAKNEAMGDLSDQDSHDWTGREAGDGTSVQPDSDFDEFSSVGSDKDYQCSVYNVPIISDCNGDSEKVVLGHCRALYEYSAKVYDELNLRIGDIIKIHDKHPDGWWLGELDGVVGIFPATYVEEINELTP